MASARLVSVTGAVFCRLSIMRLAMVCRRAVMGTASASRAHVRFANPPAAAAASQLGCVNAKFGGDAARARCHWSARRCLECGAIGARPHRGAEQESETLAYDYDRARLRRARRHIEDPVVE